MEALPFILATAGHVDHGKSALVKALTGTDPDRLPEEKARQITIDLGFAHLRLASPAIAGPPVQYEVGIIDVPGHEDFVRNMVAGAGSADAAMLVVAADDGWMPQTEEHLRILTYLGICRGVIALTKIDLVEDRRDVVASIRQQLVGTPLANATIVETSTLTGRGLDDLKRALATTFAGAAPRPDSGKPWLPVDRVFDLKGTGTVVTGTLAGGSLNRGDEVLVQPSGIAARVRGIQSYHRNVTRGMPGSRVALNLSGPGISRETVGRGDIVTIAGLGVVTSEFDVILERLDRRSEANPPGMRDGLAVAVHLGTAWREAIVRPLDDKKKLSPGQKGLARIKLKSAIAVFAGDRFIVRDAAQRWTLAGGMVLDPSPPKRARRGRHFESQRALLEARAACPDSSSVFASSQVARDAIVHIDDVDRLNAFSRARIEADVASLISSDAIRPLGAFLADARWWKQLSAAAAKAIDQHHVAFPQDSGLPLMALRKLVGTAIPRAAAVALEPIIAALTAELSQIGYATAPGGAAVRRVDHLPRLPDRLARVGANLRKKLAEHPLDPPSVPDLAPDDLSRQALRFLIATGQAVELSAAIVIGAEAYARAIAAIRAHLASHGQATVSELKQALNSSRRVMVPLLERMDRDRITRRRGDLRELAAPAAPLPS